MRIVLLASRPSVRSSCTRFLMRRRRPVAAPTWTRSRSSSTNSGPPAPPAHEQVHVLQIVVVDAGRVQAPEQVAEPAREAAPLGRRRGPERGPVAVCSERVRHLAGHEEAPAQHPETALLHRGHHRGDAEPQRRQPPGGDERPARRRRAAEAAERDAPGVDVVALDVERAGAGHDATHHHLPLQLDHPAVGIGEQPVGIDVGADRRVRIDTRRQPHVQTARGDLAAPARQRSMRDLSEQRLDPRDVRVPGQRLGPPPRGSREGIVLGAEGLLDGAPERVQVLGILDHERSERALEQLRRAGAPARDDRDAGGARLQDDVAERLLA